MFNKKMLVAVAMLAAFNSSVWADDQDENQTHGPVQGVKHAAHVVATDVKDGAHHVANSVRKVKRRIFVRCSDGRHTSRGAAGCARHGGVSRAR
jgi:hypothetical protein